MIVELIVENLAIIDRVQLQLGPGFTVLTGETGAGKSLLIDAIELVLGERADSDLVRSGMSKASVSVAFDLSARPDILSALESLGIGVEDGLLTIHRDVFAEGRSQCRIAGRLAPLSQLKQLGSLLVDLHGQHDHQSLLDPAKHLHFFDDWIGEPAATLRGKVADAFANVMEIRTKLDASRKSVRDREHRLDLLRFQIEEIESASPVAGEFDTLESKLNRLRNIERLTQSAASALESMTRDFGAGDLLREALKALDQVHKLDSDAADMIAGFLDAQIKLDEATSQLNAYVDGLEADPAELEFTAERLDILKRLRRKYGADEAEILAFLHGAQSELDGLLSAEEDEGELELRLVAAEQSLQEKAEHLSELRRSKAEEFGSLVVVQLRELSMPRAIFQASVSAKAVDASGADAVEFFFTANAGEPPRPLAKIASGGEISRVMLAIKTTMAGRAGVPTLIFDEVDSGLGGAAAVTVGSKLEELSLNYQVLVISHLPAIAAKAASHFRIEKTERNGRVVTAVRHIESEERVDEIARMLVGEAVTDSARSSAAELLGQQ